MMDTLGWIILSIIERLSFSEVKIATIWVGASESVPYTEVSFIQSMRSSTVSMEVMAWLKRGKGKGGMPKKTSFEPSGFSQGEQERSKIPLPPWVHSHTCPLSPGLRIERAVAY